MRSAPHFELSAQHCDIGATERMTRAHGVYAALHLLRSVVTGYIRINKKNKKIGNALDRRARNGR